MQGIHMSHLRQHLKLSDGVVLFFTGSGSERSLISNCWTPILRFEKLRSRSENLMKTFLQLIVCIAVGCLVWGCQTCTIEPPPTGVQTDKEAGAKAAASALTTAV